MGVSAPEPVAGVVSAHSFKPVYPKQKLAAPITEISQHCVAGLQGGAHCLQALVGYSQVGASVSHSLSAKQSRNKSTGKLIREKKVLPSNSKCLAGRRGLCYIPQLLVQEALLIPTPLPTRKPPEESFSSFGRCS